MRTTTHPTWAYKTALRQALADSGKMYCWDCWRDVKGGGLGKDMPLESLRCVAVSVDMVTV
jgi:hypothetical protein